MNRGVEGYDEIQDFIDEHLHNYLAGYESLKSDCWKARYYDCTSCSSRKQKLDNIHKPFFDRAKQSIEVFMTALD